MRRAGMDDMKKTLYGDADANPKEVKAEQASEAITPHLNAAIPRMDFTHGDDFQSRLNAADHQEIFVKDSFKAVQLADNSLANSIVIGDFLVKINVKDGTFEFGEGYEPEEAARIFLQAVVGTSPFVENGNLKRENEALRELVRECLRAMNKATDEMWDLAPGSFRKISIELENAKQKIKEKLDFIG